MSALRLVLGDQLTHELGSLRDVQPDDVVLLCEVYDEATYVRHHQQKLVFIFSAMRHFAQSLRARGVRVEYVTLDAPGNTGSFTGEVQRALARHPIDRIIVTEPGEWRVLQMFEAWPAQLPVPVEIREDDRFLCSRAEFAAWASARHGLRRDFFYRQLRRKTGWLMQGDQPEGGQWNYDPENRKRLPRAHRPPQRMAFTPDAVTRAVIDMVRARFADHFGELEPFGWAVTRADALRALQHFIDDCLPRFGDYQDAMSGDADFLYHSIISPYLNVGLLTALEVCAAALSAWREGRAPLNAVEGFIRQILGWREYVRGLYWFNGPEYAHSNYFNANRSLPAFFWDGNTPMNCLRQCIRNTRQHAYAHHIQRLMVIGNFALLAGLAPREVQAWYLLVYADAFEWVELPNTHGMALFADGGVLASKPYAASGAYINRMSDYCGGCAFDVKLKTGNRACPFNSLYWNFLIQHRALLLSNPRMAMPYRNLAAMPDGQRQALQKQARAFLTTLDQESRAQQPV